MRHTSKRGFAILGALMLMAMLALIAIAVLSFASADRRRAIQEGRVELREGCVVSGLNYARTYFGSNPTNWDTYFADDATYNPITGTADTSEAGIKAICVAHPELCLDLDGDGRRDVYVFIRDNYDEFAPAVSNFQRDNDQNAIIGAMCVSNTMQPRREDNSLDNSRWDGTGWTSDLLLMESILSINLTNGGYGACPNGNCNP